MAHNDQKPHPPIWVAGQQPATYELAAQKGIGAMALGISAPSVQAPNIKTYKENVKKANPVGKFINDQWLSVTMGHCGEDNKAARDLAAESLKVFFGPGKPYLQGQKDLFAKLIESWGGVPDHLAHNFKRFQQPDGAQAADLSGGAFGKHTWDDFDADTLAERGVIVAGDPESCIKAAKLHEETGVDQLQMMVATETIGHEQAMKSIELFGKYVIPEFKKVKEPAKS